MLFTQDIGIDLGTANTLVFVKGKGIVIREPSVVAVDVRSTPNKVVAVGSEAKEMIGRTPGSITAVRPLKDGVIADFDITSDMLKEFIVGFTDMTKSKQHMSPYELGVFFSVFVMMQFWNIFNAKYFRSGRSLILDIHDFIFIPKSLEKNYSSGFLLVVVVILLGQIFIVNFASGFFKVAPLTALDWALIILLTSPILIFPDIYRWLTRKHPND